jgi:U32 family peptidase
MENKNGQKMTAAPGSGHIVRCPIPTPSLVSDINEYSLLMRYIPG